MKNLVQYYNEERDEAFEDIKRQAEKATKEMREVLNYLDALTEMAGMPNYINDGSLGMDLPKEVSRAINKFNQLQDFVSHLK